jgi:hypothetical protein
VTKVFLKAGLMAVTTAMLAASPLLSGQASAAPAVTHSDGIKTTIQVVASGLNAPRGLVYDRWTGQVLVAEAGVAAGNNGPCAAGEGGTELCYGPTGSILDYSTHSGHTRELFTGLASESDTGKTFVLGLHDISLSDGQLTGVFGLLGTPTTRTGLGPGAADMGQLVKFGWDGKVKPIADIASFETALYGTDQESDPYGVTTGDFGTYIANAGGHAVNGNIGGNDILKLTHGHLTEVVAFPQRVPAANPKDIVESVPTDVVRGPDGAFYVGELTGYPYYVGEARVWRVVPGQAPTIYASGFTNIIDLAFDSRGRLLVLEIAKNGLLATDQTGAIIRVDRDGKQTLLASTGLTNPGGIAVVNDNTFYVTNNTSGIGGDGQLLKVHVQG